MKIYDIKINRQLSIIWDGACCVLKIIVQCICPHFYEEIDRQKNIMLECDGDSFTNLKTTYKCKWCKYKYTESVDLYKD